MMRIYRNIAFLIVAMTFMSAYVADAMKLNGTRIDKKNNLFGLVKDSRTGKGIAGVPVTDGYTFTVTDRNGVYQFVADEKCRNVYYTLPAEYKTALDPVTKLPLFYSTTPIDRSRQNRNDFVLEPLDAPEKDFTLVMIGDPQCKTDSDVHRFETETLPDLNRFMSESQAKGKYLNAYAVTLGDLTFDNTVQWGADAQGPLGVRAGVWGLSPDLQLCRQPRP